jgi:hypothetical protein
MKIVEQEPSYYCCTQHPAKISGQEKWTTLEPSRGVIFLNIPRFFDEGKKREWYVHFKCKSLCCEYTNEEKIHPILQPFLRFAILFLSRGAWLCVWSLDETQKRKNDKDIGEI